MTEPEIIFELCKIKWERIFLSLEVQQIVRRMLHSVWKELEKLYMKNRKAQRVSVRRFWKKSRFLMKRKRMDVIIFS